MDAVLFGVGTANAGIAFLGIKDESHMTTIGKGIYLYILVVGIALSVAGLIS
jgi:hypothetical protein